MTGQKEIVCGCGQKMIKQPGMMVANLTTANGQVQTVLSEDWYQCSNGHKMGYTDRHVS
jgi:hypothetical protein